MTFRRYLSRLRPLVLVLGFGGAALVLIAALALDKGLGKDVLIITPHDPSIVGLNQSLYVPGDPVAEIYGNPMSETVRIVHPSKDKLIRPKEDPNLLLLRANKLLGENPLQTKTIWYFARFILPVLLILGIIGFVLPKPRSTDED
ncbi:MAG: hypothetical protein KJ970_08645 [Candidatus Eisenbacteria bacterium]|uniref:Uncharacterized protein n=1 Tax=Eiseniibacteriota bacterium TaxID=2212470 RepID=A0A948W600_UNCEI|nr:hypothetical protein [Candidatus Eisenbacteria bacterium]MBU1948674.1 hypothetical protein [Candidatus Eisenbacteria bacterium]MBU2690984.1 hypothetical protein [Candidatus Eisenbacteria bacterium]